MTNAETILAMQEAKSTFSLRGTSAFPLSLVMLPYAGASAYLASAAQQFVALTHAPETNQMTQLADTIGYRELFGELSRVCDYFIAANVELDNDSHRILYSNLWDLYE